MAVTKLETGMVFQDAEHLYITPYTDSEGTNLGTDTYDLRAIVADSMSIEQDDNETNSKEWEFGDSPLLENVTLGSFQFSATCIDFQNVVLTKLFGCEEKNGVIMFPSQYKDLYCAVRITFANSNSKDIIIPKLKMNSKAVIGTLKTGSAEGTISGTAYATEVKGASSGDAVETPMFFAAHPSNEGASAWTIKSNGSFESIDYSA